MSRRIIRTNRAPQAIGAYSQAVLVDGWLYASGQIGLDPGSGEMVSGGVEAQAEQVMKNLRAVLSEAGGDFGDVVKTTIYLSTMEDFVRVNEIYARAMGEARPARATVAAAGLPKGALVEIDVVARIGS